MSEFSDRAGGVGMASHRRARPSGQAGLDALPAGSRGAVPELGPARRFSPFCLLPLRPYTLPSIGFILNFYLSR